MARRSSAQSMSLADVAAAATMDAGVAPKGQFPNGDGARGGDAKLRVWPRARTRLPLFFDNMCTRVPIATQIMFMPCREHVVMVATLMVQPAGVLSAVLSLLSLSACSGPALLALMLIGQAPTGLLRASSSPSAHRPGATSPPISPPARRDGAAPGSLRRSPPEDAAAMAPAAQASPFASALQTPPTAGSESARAGAAHAPIIFPTRFPCTQVLAAQETLDDASKAYVDHFDAPRSRHFSVHCRAYIRVRQVTRDNK